jgi:putative sterol carrier protein
MWGVHSSHRFDVEGVGSWCVYVDDGEFDVVESAEEADLILELTEEVFLAIVRGEQNAAIAILDGSMKALGDFSLAPKLERLYSPAKAR